jgi:hypothetical protein
MTFQTVTLKMPTPVYRRAQNAATALRRPMEEVLVDTLSVALPPLDDVPQEMVSELAAMIALSNEALWKIARSVMPTKKQTILRSLSRARRKRELPPPETRKLRELQQEYGRITLRKAQAYALLHHRGLYSPTTE